MLIGLFTLRPPKSGRTGRLAPGAVDLMHSDYASAASGCQQWTRTDSM
jgi:hypothetical protein